MHISISRPVRKGVAASGDDDMDVDGQAHGAAHVVTPGEVITRDPAFAGGLGTIPTLDRSVDPTIIASVTGIVDRVNKFIRVQQLRARYHGEVGDVIVGRVSELGPKRWKIDFGGQLDGVLTLDSISLPGGVQRRKSESDELHMREYFAEGDLICAEISSRYRDGAAQLNMRGKSFGKLRNGNLVTVPSSLVKRSKSHFTTLSCGVDAVLGMNGWIWVRKHETMAEDQSIQQETNFNGQNDPLTEREREDIARVSNCIQALGQANNLINDSMISYTYEAALEYPLKELIRDEVREQIVVIARSELASAMQQ
ncbi:Exosome complex component RRP4 [Rhizophlyctis rosea]|uniref:Exosome complex component RRP4 n=1 Tax=Rhizophlyctis rosea TaxID=64517 RepID=A0AAD5X2I2_9FUNG|nr:Exosome complex component RRP4 [Rhizophlyctis rosea]